MTAIAMGGLALMGFSHNYFARALASLASLFDVKRPMPPASAKVEQRVPELDQAQADVGAIQAVVPADLGARAGRRSKPGQRLAYGAVRELVRRDRDALQAVELSTGEACVAAEALGWKPRFLKGDKLAVCLRRVSNGEVLAVAICARPSLGLLDDALTLELRCFVGDVTDAVVGRKLVEAVAGSASSKGFRRLVVEGSAMAAASPAMSGWDKVASAYRADGRFALWCSVLRGDGRIS